MYWCITWLLVFALPVTARICLDSMPFDQLAVELINDFWFPIVISTLVLPIVAWDSLRFSNKVAGPIYRATRELNRFNSGEPIPPIKLREGDFCHELVAELNEVFKKHSLKQQTQHQTEELEEV